MSIREKRSVIFVIMLILIAVGLHECGGDVCGAEEPKTVSATATPTATATAHWLIISEDTKTAWTMLRDAGYSEVACAAILGNLHYESRMIPDRIEHLQPEQSEELAEHRQKNRNNFIYEPNGYGLAGWTGTTNLSRLWDFCEESGYEVDTIEGQIAFLIEDYPFMAENSYKRMQYYGVADIVTATEDFRQSYEKSIYNEQSQYARAKLAKSIYAAYCEDIYTIEISSQAPMNYDIYMKVKELNKKLGIVND